MTAFYAPDPINSTQLIPGGNTPAAGGLLFCYQVGSSTKQNTYTDATASTARTNPIVLDSGGNIPGNGEVWIASTAKFVLAPSNDTDPPASPYWSRDNLPGVNDPSQVQSEWIPSGLTPTFVSGSSFIFSGDQTGTFTTGRRLKTLNTAGTFYSTISTSVFSASTTIGIQSDTIGIDSGLSAVSYGLINPKNTSLPLIVSVLNFGAKGDGVTDDTAAIQAAVTAALGRSLYFPPGFYVINSEITISGSITIFGAGVEISVIQLGTTTQNGFNIACDSSVHFRDMKVFGGASQTAGAAIKVNGATNGVTTNLNSTFENLLFSQCWNSIEFISVASARIHNCVINGILNVGVTVQDTVNADSTPSWITDCAFFGNSSSASLKGISHLSGGGLRVVNNYFNTLGAAYHMNWGSTVGSSQIRIANNTVDSNQQVGGFIFDRSTASGGIAGISIVGNYLFTNTVTPAIWFKKNDPGVFVNTTLNGNNFILSGGGTGIQIDGGIAYEICGNQFTGPTGTGIATVNSTATSIQIGPNQFTNISTAYSINTASQITPTAIHGTGSNDNANASDIGEYSTATIATGSSLSLTSPNALNVTNFTLTPGDWDVWGVIDYLAGGATTFTVMKSGISTTSATIGSQDTFTNLALAGTLAAASDMAQTTPTVRISIASSTIVYLVAQVTFAVSTLKVYGSIFARRVR